MYVKFCPIIGNSLFGSKKKCRLSTFVYRYLDKNIDFLKKKTQKLFIRINIAKDTWDKNPV